MQQTFYLRWVCLVPAFFLVGKAAANETTPRKASKRTRFFQVGADLGVASELSHHYRKLALDQNAGRYAVNVVFQSGAFGLYLRGGGVSGSNHRIEGADAQFTSYRLGGGVAYEFAPLPRGSRFFQRLHVALLLGGGYGSHRVQISEGSVKLTDQARGFMPLGGFEIRFALPVGLWIVIREEYTRYRMTLKNLAFDETIEELSSTVGVRYAF